MKNDKGYIHIYTGNGKGKTTCALGLSLRAVCAGKKVFFGQFVKGMKYSELDAIKYLPNFKMRQYGRNCFVYNNPAEEDIETAKNGLLEMENILADGKFDLVVMDELNIALYYKLFSVEDVIKVLDKRKENVEIIITGRYALKELIDKADLVTEMKEIKHYYKKGVQARTGIEK
ncbi:cob(I)yrinic acid a,c-diamide adenosyltransferase [Clostridium sp. ZS2-4]|uniref:cob(I)yrinic acid a,c-diamide adenosyltransferase n=1 Tax=Clostridium sp. ZS2-4 TaxID=2987703 RepID=UPI00227D0FE8|nr:cob(I)yrinic acid a,c-diamide adenosyltransferase [Clostridium sp. ZS2-4]MCY6354972.1 cob(I)yrinic acid a,c-diamide adenosyltransferase [Clostridium sp. ZS2-4]